MEAWWVFISAGDGGEGHPQRGSRHLSCARTRRLLAASFVGRREMEVRIFAFFVVGSLVFLRSTERVPEPFFFFFAHVVFLAASPGARRAPSVRVVGPCCVAKSSRAADAADAADTAARDVGGMTRWPP